MDHIIENEGTPVPDPSAVSGTQISQPTGGAAGEDMDDEDVAALKAVYGHKGGAEAQAAAAAADVEAKVRTTVFTDVAWLKRIFCCIYRVSNVLSAVKSSEILLWHNSTLRRVVTTNSRNRPKRSVL